MERRGKKLNGVMLFAAASLISFGCITDGGSQTPDAASATNADGGVDGSSGSSSIACDDATDFMEVVVSSAPKAAYVRITPDAYGANLFYIYEVIVDPADAEQHLYATNNNPVETSIASKDWAIPAGTLWSAGRLELDGLDPFTPSTDNWFIYPYLPFAKWTSSSDLKSDGSTCPGLTGSDSYGRPRCIGAQQLDDSAPNLEDGKLYLIRMVMNIQVGGSRPIACYQRVFPYTRGTYTRL